MVYQSPDRINSIYNIVCCLNRRHTYAENFSMTFKGYKCSLRIVRECWCLFLYPTYLLWVDEKKMFIRKFSEWFIWGSFSSI
jgi:hypothetical protein